MVCVPVAGSTHSAGSISSGLFFPAVWSASHAGAVADESEGRLGYCCHQHSTEPSADSGCRHHQPTHWHPTGRLCPEGSWFSLCTQRVVTFWWVGMVDQSFSWIVIWKQTFLSMLVLLEVWNHYIAILLFTNLFLFLSLSASDSVISLQDAFLQCPAQESGPSTPSHTPPPSAGISHTSFTDHACFS